MTTGLIVKHSSFVGLGRVISHDDGSAKVQFFSKGDETLQFTYGLTRVLLPIGTVCKGPKGSCNIIKRTPGDGEDAPTIYTVEYDKGHSRPAKVSEVDLLPLEVPPPAYPQDGLASADAADYQVFKRREALEEAWLRDLRDGQGARALLASRIDLRPHQAHVAATVLLDQKRRYILADEVGLGKTIEAGIIIHDLLSRKPQSKILILCPGALTQQWFCEIFAKFCNRVFKLPELRGGAISRAWDHVIISFSNALACHEELEKRSWDLVVIDEAHHLLALPPLYRLAQHIAAKTGGLLLLSALPAQQKEEEYLRLLALLEPDRYDPSSPTHKKQFRELYARQGDIGAKIGYISRRLLGLADDPSNREKAIQKAGELAKMPVLCDDQKLISMVASLKSAEASFADDAKQVLHHVGDTYRINRRILRNRRERLIEQSQVSPVKRLLRQVHYSPDQLELDAAAATREFLKALLEAEVGEESVLPLARQAFQALASPRALCHLLNLSAEAGSSGEAGGSMLALDALTGYPEWEGQVKSLWATVSPHLSTERLGRAKRAASAWLTSEKWPRMRALCNLLKKRHDGDPAVKIVAFAGFPGLAEQVGSELQRSFGRDAVAQFRSALSADEKEAEVRRFRMTASCWLLVCDESGGEGRNFQFASELVHVDLPWHVARVEQRIGRLDRLGREMPEATSTVVFAEGSEEDGLLTCFEKGLEVFSRSISGLEFALRSLEATVAKTSISAGRDGLAALAPELKEASENERALDLAQEVYDAGSSGSPDAFRRLLSTPGRDRILEEAFIKYLISLSSPRAIGGERNSGVVTFKLEELPGIDLKVAKDVHGHYPRQTGTFVRKIAQDRPELKFFSVGSELCDAVIEFLMHSTKGRWYSMECKATHREWRGFEVAFRVSCKKYLEVERLGFSNRLERVFSLPLIRCFVDEAGRCASAADATELLRIRRGLSWRERGASWWDLGSEMDEYYKDWPGAVNKAEAVARKAAGKDVAEALAKSMPAELLRIEEQLAQAKRLKPTGWKAESESLRHLASALESWSLDLDGIGYLSVNGGVRG